MQDSPRASIDIAIGTHKLLSRDVRFKNLGLVIIDEEHRFGVRQKERLKALRAEVDVLTLTATPIPRTLAMSLEGLRDFSVIATAPERRLAIKTFVSRYSKPLMREAVLRELKRGGQIYFLHNDIDTIEQIEEILTKLVPEARIRVAHGQMRERELEHVMRDFYQQRFNLLLCTTIIETGIDVPTANTIIINRADKFGLAQLHQLRGRVGRSHHQAYAYLLLPEEGNVTAQAKKRLEAIQMMEELGSGFFLAMHDLEIRGAGRSARRRRRAAKCRKSGSTSTARCSIRRCSSLKLGREPDLAAPLGVTTEINLHAPALLPADYVYGRPRAARALQAARQLRDDGRARRAARRADRPLRRTARADARADRHPPPAHPGQAARHRAHRRDGHRDPAPVRPEAADRAAEGAEARAVAAATTGSPGQDRLRIEVPLPDVRSRVAAIREAFGELS